LRTGRRLGDRINCRQTAKHTEENDGFVAVFEDCARADQSDQNAHDDELANDKLSEHHCTART